MKFIFALALVALVVGAAGQAGTDMVADIKAAGATKWLDIVKAAGALDALSKHGMAAGTVCLVPTNAAVDAWLQANGLTLATLAPRKAMVQRMVGYLVTFPSGDLKTSMASGAPMSVPTANMMWNVTLTNKGGRITAMDTHDVTATVTPTASKHVFTIDKMLLPGNVFPSLGAMGFRSTGSMRQPFSVFQAALDRANLMTDMKNQGSTIFVPTDAAFAAAGFSKDTIASASPATLKTILEYHTIPGYKVIPKDFKSGAPVATLLPGASITVKTSETPMAGMKNMMMGKATVVDSAGNVANVVAPNYFTGKSVIHGIDRVLSPAQKTAAAAPAAMAATTGRRLTQIGRSPDTSYIFAQQNSRDAILASVNSDAPDAAFRATQVASQNAMFTAYPSTPEFLYVGANTGRGR